MMLLWSKLSLLLPSKRRARELSLEEELQSHIDLVSDDAIIQGATPEQAKFAARRDLGSALRAKEEIRTVWGFAAWDRLSQDLTYSFRTLRHAPTFTIVAILSLALGIGSATAIFSLVNAILLKPLSYADSNQLIEIREVVPPWTNMYPTFPVNYEHFRYWREHARSFESLALLQGDKVNLNAAGDPVKLDSVDVSANLFRLLRVQPQLGRAFLPEEEQRGHSRVAVITDSLWKRRFGGAPDLLGKTIALDYLPITVVGILPPSFRFPKNDDLGPLTQLGKNTEVFLPFTQAEIGAGWDGDYDYAVFARLKPGISLARAIAELNLLEHQIDTEHHLAPGLHVSCKPLQDVIATPVRTPLYVLLGAVLLLLLIVCVNLANLILARTSVRAREFSIRTALGAGRTRLIQQLVIETSLLCLAGGALGLVLATLAVHGFVAATLAQIPRIDEVQVDRPVFLFSLMLSIACGLISGLLPALRMTKLDAQESLRAGSHTIAGNRQVLRLREILVGSEVAISVVLLFGAGLMMASLARLLSTDKGFTVEQAVALDIALPYTHYKSDQDNLRFWDRALDGLRSIPGVRSAAFVSKLPLTGEGMVNDVVLEGADQSALDPVSRTRIEINVRYVSDDYFNTLGIPLIRGRFIESGDRKRAVAVVSARLAAKLWPGRNPLGKKLTTGAMVGKAEVVGVVKDVHGTRLDQDPTLMLYVPCWHRGLGSGSLVIRTAGDPATLIPAIRNQIQRVDPSLPASETRTVAKLISQSLSRRYFQLRLAAGFAGAALALALIGIYGVVAYNVAQRRTEIAVRLALGASRLNVLQVLLRYGFRPVLIGLLIGLLCAAASAQFIRSILFGVTPADPVTMLSVILLLAITAFCACMLPAQSAIRADPATALHYE